MLRFIFTVVCVVALVYFGATVKLGDKTFFQHVRAIWHSPETQDLKRGVEDTARPAVKKLEHGASEGYRALTSDDGSAGSAGSAAPVPAQP
ncbi:MAG TPA: hypothetical protein VGG74_31070 [Kofleriaceae bacterium]